VETNNQARQVFYQAYKKLTGYKEPIIGRSIDTTDKKPKFNPIIKGFRRLQKLTKKLMKVEAKGFTLPEILQEPLAKELNDNSLEKVKKKNGSEIKKKISSVNKSEEQKHIPKSEKKADTGNDKKGKITPEKKPKASPIKKPISPEKRMADSKVDENIKKKGIKRTAAEKSIANEHMKKLQVPLKKFKEDVILEVDEPMPEPKKKTKPKKTETKKVKFDLASNTTRSTLP
jgi:hypothetical protein